jgi:hypothetical protein
MNCHSILHSHLFTFLVEEDEKSFVVHSTVISALSPALNTLINGEMIEAKTKITRWPFVDVGTFIRLCEFAYRQDYEPPGYEIESLEVEDGKENPMIMEDAPLPSAARASDEYRSLSRKQKKKSFHTTWDEEPPVDTPSSKVLVRQAFENIDYSMREAILERYKPVRNKSSNEDYTPVFLGHARLYVLADKYGVDALKTLVLHKIHETLLKFTLYPNRIGDVIELVKFAYSDDKTMDIKGTPDKLRAMVVHYIVSEIDLITGAREFLELLEDGGPFVKDFWIKVKTEII